MKIIIYICNYKSPGLIFYC